ncbi:amidohydrolase family protein [Gluconobacter wancherniae]|uniref:amidohydrolase family protein n=1 Tax=Gluconobacter wancherniae TaxID=1307955 RepID=UPI0030AEC9B3
MSGFVLAGRILDPISPGCTSLTWSALRIDDHGIIAQRAEEGSNAYNDLCKSPGTISLSADSILMPGLTDLHIHAPQWPQAGKALDLPLEQWLGRYTFPLESRYADLDFAACVYDELVPTLLRNGTTTALYFATIHEEASLELAKSCLRHGQRGFVGLVAMDDPQLCPPEYRNSSAAAAIEATRRFITAVQQLPGNESGLVQPVITPRFIPACSDALLQGLGDLARETGVRVQTHASESDWEHQHVLSRLHCTDTEALDSFGLLRPCTILAHSNFVTHQDRTLIRNRSAGLAHCPISNAFFAGAVLPVRKILDENVRCGLGTDISGGYSPSILENARQAVLAARMLDSGTDPHISPQSRGAPSNRIDFQEAFWLATRGGAEALGVPTGQLQTGMTFDALEITSGRSSLRLDLNENGPTAAQKIVCHAGPENIARVWINGRLIRKE